MLHGEEKTLYVKIPKKVSCSKAPVSQGSSNGAPHPYRKEKEIRELIFSCRFIMAWVLLVGAYAWGQRRSRARCIFVPRGRAPLGQHQESRPLARSNTGSLRFTDLPSLGACSESSLTNRIGSGLNLLCLQSHSKPECRWNWPEVAILGADQKERSLWGRECARWYHVPANKLTDIHSQFAASLFDIGQPCYGRLTPVKTRHPLTSITWPYRGLKFRAQ